MEEDAERARETRHSTAAGAAAVVFKPLSAGEFVRAENDLLDGGPDSAVVLDVNQGSLPAVPRTAAAVPFALFCCFNTL